MQAVALSLLRPSLVEEGGERRDQSMGSRAVNDSTLVPAHEYDFGLFPHCDSGTESMRKCADSTACTDTNACAGTNVGADSNYVARKM